MSTDTVPVPPTTPVPPQSGVTPAVPPVITPVPVTPTPVTPPPVMPSTPTPVPPVVAPIVTPAPITPQPVAPVLPVSAMPTPNTVQPPISFPQSPPPTQPPMTMPTTMAPTPNIPQGTPNQQQISNDQPPSKPKILLKWVTMFGLTAIGLKGFIDSLYFILVEFQNFEKALEERLVETALVNQLIMKAVLLIFMTALSVFFASQLSLTHAKKLHWLKLIASIAVGVACFFVIQYANTIHVLDVIKQ